MDCTAILGRARQILKHAAVHAQTTVLSAHDISCCIGVLLSCLGLHIHAFDDVAMP